jgi:2-isopropylmalate synthase
MKKKKFRVEILDTTFRDGMQQEGMKMGLKESLRVIKKMAGLGLHYAELGFAGSHSSVTKRIEAAVAIKDELYPMKLAAFGRTKEEDVEEIIRLGVPVAVLFCKSRLMDVRESLRISESENLAIIKDSIRHLKKKRIEVILDLEHSVDAWFGRGNFGEYFDKVEAEEHRAHFLGVVRTGIDTGVDCLVVCDTNGNATPEEVTEMITFLKNVFPGVSFGFHGHNDFELAVANSRAAVFAGADHIHGTINGYGERCGNANLCSLLPRLQLKDGIEIVSPENLKMLTSFSNLVASYFGQYFDKRSPAVGDNAATTLAGAHAASEGRSEGSYLPFHPELVGNKARIKINSQSGNSNVILLAKQLGIEMTDEEAIRLMSYYSDHIDSGAFNVSEESFYLACQHIKGLSPKFFKITEYEAGTRRKDEGQESSGSATMYVQIDNGSKEPLIDTASGKGSFDALSRALHKALIPHYPEIADVHLLDYWNHAIGVLEEETGAPVVVLAKFSSNGDVWPMVGVSKDQTDAALRAYVAGLRWFLFNLNKY